MERSWIPPERLTWWNEAKFGLFIHWGPYALAGVEASWPIMFPEAVPAMFGPQPPISQADYEALAARFKPSAFDPATWVAQAQAAGMRYLVFTAKHHDGYCLFDAPGTDYKTTAGPMGRDVVAELSEACRAAKMPLGLYYSPPDLHHPGYRDTRQLAVKNWIGQADRPEWAGYLDAMEGHLRRLLTAYGPIAIVWFDALFGHDRYQPQRFHRLVHELCPEALINDRLGPWLGDYVTPEQFVPTGIPVQSPERRPESAGTRRLIKLMGWALRSRWVRRQVARSIGRSLSRGAQLGNVLVATLPQPEAFQPWETCMTLSRTWAYNPHDTAWKPVETVIRTLVEVASRGGNLLLNVGPGPEGVFPAEAVERLKGVGGWLRRNGEAIYGTTYGPIQGRPDVRTTRKGEMLYVHVFQWPSGGRVVLPLSGHQVVEARLLATGERLPFSDRDGALELRGPSKAPDNPISVMALRLATG